MVKVNKNSKTLTVEQLREIVNSIPTECNKLKIKFQTNDDGWCTNYDVYGAYVDTDCYCPDEIEINFVTALHKDKLLENNEEIELGEGLSIQDLKEYYTAFCKQYYGAEEDN